MREMKIAVSTNIDPFIVELYLCSESFQGGVHGVAKSFIHRRPLFMAARGNGGRRKCARGRIFSHRRLRLVAAVQCACACS